MKEPKLTPEKVSEILKSKHTSCVNRINQYFGPFETRIDSKTKDGGSTEHLGNIHSRSAKFDRVCETIIPLFTNMICSWLVVYISTERTRNALVAA